MGLFVGANLFVRAWCGIAFGLGGENIPGLFGQLSWGITIHHREALWAFYGDF